jgi:hypothetical protein
MSEGSRETKKAVMKTTNGGHFNLVPLKFDVLHHEMRNSELKIAIPNLGIGSDLKHLQNLHGSEQHSVHACIYCHTTTLISS